jgi:rod shape-determining protein MreD
VTYAIALAVAWIFSVLQVSVMPYLHVLGVTPDFVLIFAGSFAVLRGRDEAFFVLPLAGLFRDLATSDPLGTSVLGFTPMVLLAAALRLRAMDSQFIPAVAVVAAGTICHAFISMVVLVATGQDIALMHAVVRVILPLAIVNALFATIVYLPVSWFRKTERSRMIGSGRLTSPL